MNTKISTYGYMLLKHLPSIIYRGVDRDPFEPLIVEKELDPTRVSDTEITDIWAMYPAGWRRDAYRMFSENQRSGPEDVVLLASLDSAKHIMKLIPQNEGRYEIVKCRILSLTKDCGGHADPPTSLLGYDVAYPGGDYYSAVRNGLFANPSADLVSEYTHHLNQFGLFSNCQHAVGFLADFRSHVPSEAESQFMVYELCATEEDKWDVGTLSTLMR